MSHTDQVTDARSVVSGGYAAFASGDIPAVLARFAPAIVWTVPGPQALAGEYHGPDGVAEFFGRLQGAYRHLEVHADEIVALDDERVLALGHHVAEGPGGRATPAFAHVWHVVDGRATAFTEYTDTEALGGVLG